MNAKQTRELFDAEDFAIATRQGYAIDAAYTNADRHLIGSDKWHYWMDRAKELETKLRAGH